MLDVRKKPVWIFNGPAAIARGIGAPSAIWSWRSMLVAVPASGGGAAWAPGTEMNMFVARNPVAIRRRTLLCIISLVL
jgi:hypothetical protein